MATYKYGTKSEADKKVNELNAKQNKRNSFVNISMKKTAKGYTVKEGR
jgi:hypothetical protein